MSGKDTKNTTGEDELLKRIRKNTTGEDECQEKLEDNEYTSASSTLMVRDCFK